MPRRRKVDPLRSICIDNICKNIKSFWYEKYWKDIYSSPERVITEVGPFEYLPGSIVNEIIEKLSDNHPVGDNVMSSLITSTLVKLSLPRTFERGPTTFDLISHRCQDTLKELMLPRNKVENSVLMKAIKSLQKLEVLNLDETSIDDGVLSVVGTHCSELRKLSLNGCREITDVSMEYLFVNESAKDGFKSYGKCKLIDSLNIRETKISNFGAEIVLRNAPKLQNLNHPTVVSALGRMHQNDLESNSPPVRYSLTSLHNEDFNRHCIMDKSLTNSLSIATRVCPHVTDVSLIVNRSVIEEGALRPLGQLENLKCLNIVHQSFRRSDILFSEVMSVLSVLGHSITRLHLVRFPWADVGIIGAYCPLLEDLCVRIIDVNGVAHSRKEIFIPPSINTTYFAFLKLLNVSMSDTDLETREDSDIKPSQWKKLLSSRHLESLTIECSSSLSDSLLNEVLKDGQVFPNLRTLDLFNCPLITTGFVKSLLNLPNPLELISVEKCRNIPQSDLDSLETLCKVNGFHVEIIILN